MVRNAGGQQALRVFLLRTERQVGHVGIQPHRTESLPPPRGLVEDEKAGWLAHRWELCKTVSRRHSHAVPGLLTTGLLTTEVSAALWVLF